jgi:PadR family transcriptional regulator
MGLGELEQVVLFALARQEAESAHAALLVAEIEARLERRVSPGALYTVLDRLELKGYVDSWIGDQTPERGGRRRKMYRLRPEGARVLREWYGGIRSMAAGVMGRLDALADERS